MFHKKAVESLTPQEVFIGSMQYGGHFTDIHEYITTYLEGVMGHPEFEYLTNGHILMMMDLLQRHFDEWFPDLEYAGISQQDWFALTQLFIKEAERTVRHILFDRKESAQEGFITRYDPYDVWIGMPTYYEQNPERQTEDDHEYYEDTLECLAQGLYDCVERNGMHEYSGYHWHIKHEGKTREHDITFFVRAGLNRDGVEQLLMQIVGTQNQFNLTAWHDTYEGKHALRVSYCVYNADHQSTLYLVPMTHEETEAISEY